MSPRESSSKKDSENALTFESALEKLEELVSRLETGDVALEESLKAFEEGKKLIQFCESKLQAAETALKELGSEAKDALQS